MAKRLLSYFKLNVSHCVHCRTSYRAHVSPTIRVSRSSPKFVTRRIVTPFHRVMLVEQLSSRSSRTSFGSSLMVSSQPNIHGCLGDMRPASTQCTLSRHSRRSIAPLNERRYLTTRDSHRLCVIT